MNKAESRYRNSSKINVNWFNCNSTYLQVSRYYINFPITQVIIITQNNLC